MDYQLPVDQRYVIAAPALKLVNETIFGTSTMEPGHAQPVAKLGICCL